MNISPNLIVSQLGNTLQGDFKLNQKLLFGLLAPPTMNLAVQKYMRFVKQNTTDKAIV